LRSRQPAQAVRAAKRGTKHSRKRRRVVGGLVLSLLVVVLVAAVIVGAKLWHGMFGTGDDYTGSGTHDIVIQVKAGDSTTAIGETLHDLNVVATVRAFVAAAHGNAAITSIQPGFYRMRTEIPAADAVARLCDPNFRVGKLVIPEGRQLDDTTDMKTKRGDARHSDPDLPVHLRGTGRQQALRLSGRVARGSDQEQSRCVVGAGVGARAGKGTR